jgi:prepilin-type N-terminal cleavage/methylation domain-containing protein/prepilin-type processing-associated H-X9-DG protein
MTAREPAKGQCKIPGLPRAPRAFTLVELLVVIAIIGMLSALLLPSLSKAKASARSVQCLSQMRQIGLAMRLYADDHRDQFPRSQHSAFAHGEFTWGRAIAPELGRSSTPWTNLFTGIYRCPADQRTAPWSYGLNVYFELGPEDDYIGKPQTWRRVASIPQPSDTILLAENATSADHVMPHFWTSPAEAEEIAAERHRRQANYLFVDGRAQRLAFSTIYKPPHLDFWNPLR